MRTMWDGGHITADTMCWQEGWGDWRFVADFLHGAEQPAFDLEAKSTPDNDVKSESEPMRESGAHDIETAAPHDPREGNKEKASPVESPPQTDIVAPRSTERSFFDGFPTFLKRAGVIAVFSILGIIVDVVTRSQFGPRSQFWFLVMSTLGSSLAFMFITQPGPSTAKSSPDIPDILPDENHLKNGPPDRTGERPADEADAQNTIRQETKADETPNEVAISSDATASSSGAASDTAPAMVATNGGVFFRRLLRFYPIAVLVAFPFAWWGGWGLALSVEASLGVAMAYALVYYVPFALCALAIGAIRRATQREWPDWSFTVVPAFLWLALILPMHMMLQSGHQAQKLASLNEQSEQTEQQSKKEEHGSKDLGIAEALTRTSISDRMERIIESDVARGRAEIEMRQLRNSVGDILITGATASEPNKAPHAGGGESVFEKVRREQMAKAQPESITKDAVQLSWLDKGIAEMVDGQRKTITGSYPKDAPQFRVQMTYPQSWVIREPIRPDIIFKVASPMLEHEVYARVTPLPDGQILSAWNRDLGQRKNGDDVPSEMAEAFLPKNCKLISARRRTVDAQSALDIICESHVDMNGIKVFMMKRFFFVIYENTFVSLEAQIGSVNDAQEEVRQRWHDAEGLFGLLFGTVIFPDRYAQRAKVKGSASVTVQGTPSARTTNGAPAPPLATGRQNDSLASRLEELRRIRDEYFIKNGGSQFLHNDGTKPSGEAEHNKSAQGTGLPRILVPTPAPRSPTQATGFLISASGHILTAAHVIAGARNVFASTSGGSPVEAAILSIDKANDLALLKVGSLPANAKPLPLAAASERTGAAVFTLGFPNTTIQGREPKLTDGRISSTSGIQDDPRIYQISVPVQPGNSGGPLLNMNGDVVGVVVSRLSAAKMLKMGADEPQNVNYAMKISVARPLIKGVPLVGAPISTAKDLPALVEKARCSVVLITTE